MIPVRPGIDPELQARAGDPVVRGAGGGSPADVVRPGAVAPGDATRADGTWPRTALHFRGTGTHCRSPQVITTRRDLLLRQFDLTWSLLESG